MQWETGVAIAIVPTIAYLGTRYITGPARRWAYRRPETNILRRLLLWSSDGEYERGIDRNGRGLGRKER